MTSSLGRNGAETSNNDGNTSGYSAGIVQNSDHAQNERDRPDRINKKALEELESNGKLLPVMVYNTKTQSNLPEPTLQIPIDVATICAKNIRTQVERFGFYQIGRNGLATDTVPGLEAFKIVFDWMNECGFVRGLAPDLDVTEIINASPDTTANVTKVIDIMKAARYVGIPHASFNKFVARKLTSEARSFLVSLNDIENEYSQEKGDEDLRVALTKSILEHWYDYTLDGHEYCGYMERLSDLRNQYGALHQDLQDRVTDKDQARKAAKKRREEEKAKNADSTNGYEADCTNGFDDPSQLLKEVKHTSSFEPHTAANGWEQNGFDGTISAQGADVALEKGLSASSNAW